jgi:ActR/RegA family two-component response regulator
MAAILVLDDEPDAVVLIQRVLKRKGHEVFVFTEEEQAIAFVRSRPVDLAILDIKLKKMSGIEVLEALKKINPAMHAMMLTGFPTLETAKRAVSLGADNELSHRAHDDFGQGRGNPQPDGQQGGEQGQSQP